MMEVEDMMLWIELEKHFLFLLFVVVQQLFA
jgi:hypothetical protein